MWRTFEAFSANLLFACHQWLGMSAPRNNTRPRLELTSGSYCSSFSFFLTLGLRDTREITQPCNALIQL